MKAVLFDLDGTLHDRNATARRRLRAHTARFGLPSGYAARFLELDDLGYRPKREVMPLLVREFGLSSTADELLADFSTHFLKAPVPMPHAHAVLRELRARGALIGVVTNGWVEAQTACLKGCGLSGLVDDVVISRAVGLSKPDPAIYRLALSRLGVAAAEAWFVGDSPRNDVWGAQAVGLRAAYLPGGPGLVGERPEVILGDLRGVLALE